MPASTVVARSGSRSGLPRNDGDGLNDWRIVGSFTPSPALAFSLVLAATMYASETRGATAVPKLSFRSTRRPLESDARAPSHWCCIVHPKLSRVARTAVPARRLVRTPRSPLTSNASVSSCSLDAAVPRRTSAW